MNLVHKSVSYHAVMQHIGTDRRFLVMLQMLRVVEKRVHQDHYYLN